MRSEMLLRVSVFLLLTSCSFTRGDVDACQSDGDCRAAFGLGAVCGSGGFCDVVSLSPRCSSPYPADLATAGEVVFLGTIIDGSLDTHVARARSVELAVRDATESGGVAGRTFGLIVCSNEENTDLDGLSQDEASVEMARHLHQVGAVAIVGPPSSNSARAAFEGTEDALLISPSASSTELTDLEPPASDESPGRLWRTTAPDGPQAARIAADIVDRGIVRLAIVHEAGAYGDGLATRVTDALPASVTVEDYQFATAGRLAELQGEVGRSDAEEVLFISSRTEDSVGFLNAASASSFYDGKTFFLTDAAANQDLVDGIADAMLEARIRGTRPRLPDEVTLDSFQARYQLTFGEDVRRFSFTSNSYDAGWIALYGIVWAVLQEDGEIDATNIARGMRRLSSGARVPLRMSSWTVVRDAFEMGDSVDVVGSSGELDYDPITEETSAVFEVWRIQSGVILPS